MEKKFDEILDDPVAVKYPRFIKYIKAVYQDRSLWALCFRSDLPMSGNNTNNYREAQFLVIKDEVLHRQKEVNVVGLVDKLTTSLEDHYKNKLLSVGSGKFDGVYSRRFKATSEGIGYRVPSLQSQRNAIAQGS